MPANHARKDARPVANAEKHSLVLYGLDENGKPRAACFAARDATLARKAAGLMRLTVLAVTSAQQIEIAAKLPVGRIYSSGRGLVPNIRAALYGKLTAAANGLATEGQHSPHSENAKPESGGRWPPGWDAIDVGQAVIAQEAEKELGWAEATVVRKDGDTFTLRWKDPPNKKLITRHRVNLGLLYSNRQAGAATSALPPAQEVTRTKEPSQSTSGKDAQPAGHRHPADWKQIDVGCLVLAKEDGPMEGWWEAVVSTKLADSFTLRWRDYEKLPMFIRERFKLGLLCPVNPQARAS